MLGYKGFNQNRVCLKKQYIIGETYHEDETILCEKGMHFCTDPLDVFSYYPPRNNSRYCLVEADNVSDEEDIDSKRVCKDLKILKEFTYKGYCKEICKYHHGKDGIVKRNGALFILSNNNIYIIEQEYTYIVIHGNNNIIIDKLNSLLFLSYGNNNVILGKYGIITNEMFLSTTKRKIIPHWTAF